MLDRVKSLGRSALRRWRAVPDGERLVRLHRKVDQLAVRLEQLARQPHAVAPARQGVDKGTQILLAQRYRELASAGMVLSLADVEFSNFSQTGEDGILHYIFSLIGMGGRRAVELCAGDGTECNSANLIVHHGWQALLVDGGERNVRRGRAFYAKIPATRISGPRFVHAWLEPATVDSLLQEHGCTGEVDLLTIDVDGIDYWLWDAVSVISPRVVAVEVNLGMSGAAVTVPYSPGFRARWIPLTDGGQPAADGRNDFFSRFAVYAGASLPAFVHLARRKGYRLIGTNTIGYNAFFLRDDVGRDHFPECTVDSCVGPVAAEIAARAGQALADYSWQPV